MFISSFTSFSRHCSRFLVIACLLAVAVPTGLTITTDSAQAASAGGGRGGGGGGKGGGGGSDDTRECASGTCIVLTDCTGGRCGPPETPCTGASCGTEKTRMTYVKTPVGCQIKTCEIRGTKMLCSSHKADDEKLCKTKS